MTEAVDWFLYDNGLRHERVKRSKGTSNIIKQKQKQIQKWLNIFIILCTKLLQKSQISFTPNNLQDSVPSIEKRYTKSIPFNEVKRIS